ncbi:MAG: YchJ family protein [Gammaproteobacteria bacterium]
MNEASLCPCGSGLDFGACCEPYIRGTAHAPDPETLMRSRYTAYTLHEMPYLAETLHPGQRNDYDEAGAAKWARESEWEGLEIVNVSNPDEHSGKVEFRATYRRDGEQFVHHELAEFRKSGDTWYFFDGKMVGPGQFTRETRKVGRNEPCPCGSGKKFKKCCGA